NAAAVAGICRQLDGLPLALELAAARIRLLPPAALLARLAAAPGYGPLELLAGGSERPARHQTLRTTIAWSYELLDPTEQALFRRMAVFRGGARLAAIVAVARELLPAATGELGLDGSAAAEAETGGAAPPDGIEVAARLASLVDKSLLRQVAAEGEAPRYMLLETIREFAWEQLAAAGGEQATGQAHARVYLILAEAAVPHFDTAQESAWLDRLAAEQDNLRAALDWARASDPSIGLRLAAAIWPFWRSRGHLREGYSYLTEFLTRAPALTAWRAKALQGAGALAYFLGDQEAAEAWHTQSLDCYHALGDIAGEAGALADVAIYAYERGAYPAAQARYEASLRLYQQIAPGAGRAFVLMMLGNTILQTGDAARARHLLAESLDLYRAVGANRGILMALTAQGEMARQLGADRAARTCYAQCVALCRATQNTHYLPLSLHNLGQALLRLGDDAQAAATFTEGLRRAGEVGNQRAAALCVAGLGGVAVVRGQALHAAHLLAAAPTLLTAHGQQLEPMDATVYAQFVARSREQLDPATWQAAWTAGQTLTLAQAMEYALQPRPPGPAAEPVSPSDTRPGHPLTPREREVLRYLTTGLTNRQIAAVLGMSVNAVERHLGTIYSKFDLHSRSAVTRYAIDHGLI
ncbi:MAG TPA: LuxR C-terminal-related transcriptional regulator, partial [Chloroflexia bacterium]|nr:LuxR C-terminal-related transcriptional regulator [Chloroflexia bacterium]